MAKISGLLFCFQGLSEQSDSQTDSRQGQGQTLTVACLPATARTVTIFGVFSEITHKTLAASSAWLVHHTPTTHQPSTASSAFVVPLEMTGTVASLEKFCLKP